MRAQAQYTIYTLNDVQSEETAPASPYLGQLWVDTSTSPPITRVWNGAEWVELNGTDKIKDEVKYVTDKQNDFEQSAGRYFNQIAETTSRVETVENDLGEVEEKYTKVSESVTKLEQTSKEITASVESVKKTSDEALKEAKKNSTDLTNYASQVNGSLTDLQNQIDGAIETWFYNYVPTTANAPASSWTTTEDKNKHLGDLFYIVDNAEKGGLVYRWALVNGVYGWVLVEDTEVAKALETAAQAKDTADGKRRVFVAQPKPPYDAGDLWTDGTNLRVCVTARASGSYNASDWGMATEYITETAAKALIKVAKDSIEMRVELTEKGLEGVKTDISKLEMIAGQVSVQARRSGVVGSTYSFDINGSGNLVLTYDGDQPPYSINDKGELVLEYEGDTPPDTWIDEDGVLNTTEESVMLSGVIGTLTSVIDGDGTWKTEFEQNGEVVSSIRFDLATRKFVFDGDIVVGNDLRDDITKITNDTLSTTNVAAKNLRVNAANILGTLTIGQLPDNVASKDDIPDGVSDEYITTITNKTLTTTDVIAKNLRVSAANILGTLTIGQLPDNVASKDDIPDGVSDEYITTITNKTLTTTNVVAKNLRVNAANIDGVLKASQIDTANLISGGILSAGSNATVSIENGETSITHVFNGKTFQADLNAAWFRSYNPYNDKWFASGNGNASGMAMVGWESGANITYTAAQAKLNGTWVGTSSQAITSDACKKHEIVDLDERHNTLFDLIRPVAYKYNDGTSDRYHTGFIANEVEEALGKAGISTQEFAGFVTIDEENEDGTTTKARCLRYEEFIAVLWCKVKQLEKRLEELA